MTPHEAANTPGVRLHPEDIDPEVWGQAVKMLANLPTEAFNEAMRFDRKIWEAS